MRAPGERWGAEGGRSGKGRWGRGSEPKGSRKQLICYGSGILLGFMRSLAPLLLIGMLALAGCAHQKGGSTSKVNAVPFSRIPESNQKLIVTPDTALVGKVVKVNPAGRFVVLNFPIGHLPTLEQRLNVYRLGLKIGEVKVTGPQMDDNIVGDVVAGDAQAGDEVRDR